jgi:hypothetical protein
MINHALRARISDAVTEALKPHPAVFAGWEGGSAGFGSLDAYSDIDLEYLVADDASFDDLYTTAETALEAISPIVARHTPQLGRYYQLKDASEFLLVDLVFLRVGEPDRHLETERHGEKVVLFDKGTWLGRVALDHAALARGRTGRLRELQTWFPMSQAFVRKAILRAQHVEAVNAFWVCTLKPLADLLRMRYCPARWDFGVRYLDRDLPADVYAQVQELALVTNLDDLERKRAQAATWATALLEELKSE